MLAQMIFPNESQKEPPYLISHSDPKVGQHQQLTCVKIFGQDVGHVYTGVNAAVRYAKQIAGIVD